MFRTKPHTGAVIEPQASARLLPLRNLQPFTAPDPLHAVFADLPSGPPQQCRDPPISVAAVLAGEFNDGPGQRIFVIAQRRLIALRAAWLIHQLARMSLTRATLLRVLYCATAPLRA